MLVVGLPNIRGGLAGWLSGEESTCEAGNTGSIPGSGRSPGAGHGNPLQNSLKKKKKKKIYLFIYILAVLALRCCMGFPLVAVSGGGPVVGGTGFSVQWLLVVEHTFWAHRLQ